MSTSENARLWYSALRSVHGFNNHQVAEAVGVSPETLGHFERGTRNISIELGKRIAKFFGVSLQKMRLTPPIDTLKKILVDS